MALGRRHHRFLPRIDDAHRTVQPPRGERNEGLHRQVELGAETAADRSRQYSHLLGRNPENLGDAVAIHIGRLGAGLDLDAIADAAGETRLGLDIGVLDKARLKNSVDDDVAVLQTRFDVAAHDPADGEHVVGAMRMEARRVRGSAPHRWFSAPAAG